MITRWLKIKSPSGQNAISGQPIFLSKITEFSGEDFPTLEVIAV